VDALIDLPFALPTAVAGIALTALYAKNGWLGEYLQLVGINVAFTPLGVLVALIFEGVPFVVRTVQPVLYELDTQMEEAARSLGASELSVFVRIVLPSILPGILSGVAMAFARACGEIGSIVILSGNIPFHTEVASVYVFNQGQNGDTVQASAVAVVLLALSFVVLLGIGGLRRLATRHERA
jgi:sulfate/thiosulfate transport system permease protein